MGVCKELKVKLLSPADIAFLRDYSITMTPLKRASNILQSESSVYMGSLLPVIHERTQQARDTKPDLQTTHQSPEKWPA
ncbi:hypothetical protein DPEC_G00318730 [Dallia pectoralis]|uniref:Uncharacterized protein n=1 Tax=Dallia pectoralis TaxID=75939 RepID=A0ACC2F9K6_DALPE|nr:hypothetical protein DPEC_G00318730 [Dallia pectoralis]